MPAVRHVQRPRVQKGSFLLSKGDVGIGIGTGWIAEKIESGIPLAEGLPKDWLDTCQIAPDEAGYLGEPSRWLEDTKLNLDQLRDLAASLARFCSAATYALSRGYCKASPHSVSYHPAPRASNYMAGG